MTDYTVFVDVDISAKTATVSWGKQLDGLTKPKTIKQDRSGWQWLIDTLQQQSVPLERSLVVMEATGTYWMQMALYLHESGCTLSVINPIRARYFGRMMMQQTKTMDPATRDLL